MHVRVFLSRYRSYRLCPACDGGRLKPDALLYTIDGRSVADVQRMSVADAAAFFDDAAAQRRPRRRSRSSS